MIVKIQNKNFFVKINDNYYNRSVSFSGLTKHKVIVSRAYNFKFKQEHLINLIKHLNKKGFIKEYFIKD